MLKKVPIREGPYELQINRLFSTEPLYSNPRNHCVHLLDVIELPNEPPILVHPLLRPYHKPPLRTFGEFVTFFAQICEVCLLCLYMARIGSLNLQGCSIYARKSCCPSVCSRSILSFPRGSILTYARDCTHGNIMLDPSNMYPGSFHPVRMSRSKDFRHKAKAYSRTRRPSRYLLIDFGLSRHYDPANGPPLDKPLRGGDKSAPEHQDGKALCNPFPTDVYYLGNLVREYFMKVRIYIRDCRNRLHVHAPEISRIRVYGTTHRRHGPGRSDQTS
jgi:hypothetical protein